MPCVTALRGGARQQRARGGICAAPLAAAWRHHWQRAAGGGGGTALRRRGGMRARARACAGVLLLRGGVCGTAACARWRRRARHCCALQPRRALFAARVLAAVAAARRRAAGTVTVGMDRLTCLRTPVQCRIVAPKDGGDERKGPENGRRQGRNSKQLKGGWKVFLRQAKYAMKCLSGWASPRFSCRGFSCKVTAAICPDSRFWISVLIVLWDGIRFRTFSAERHSFFFR